MSQPTHRLKHSGLVFFLFAGSTLFFFSTPLPSLATSSFTPPTSNLTLYPPQPLTSYSTIKPLTTPLERTPPALTFGQPPSTVPTPSRDEAIADAFNQYLLDLQTLETNNNGVVEPTTDLTTILGNEELQTILDNADTTDSLLAAAGSDTTSPTTAAAILLILTLGLTAWAVSYRQAQIDYAIEQARLETLALQEAADTLQKAQALQAEEQAFVAAATAAANNPNTPPIVYNPSIPPNLYRFTDWVDAAGKHFPRYGMVVGNVWHDVSDVSEVERIFGSSNSIRQVERGSYTAGWTQSHGGGTTGGAMTLLALWQQQTEVLMDGSLPSTPEAYAKGIPGTNHPLGWTFSPAQMYNPYDQTIYVVDSSSMAEFYNQLGWTSISYDTPKTKISSLAFDTPSAFTNKTPWTGSYNQGSLQYQPNHVYENPTPTEFQRYFKEQREQGRTTQDIYQNNPYLIKPLTYVPTLPQPTVTVAAVQPVVPPVVPATYAWEVPFRSGLTQQQKESITRMLTNRTNQNETLNETDARNFAYATNQTNWGQYVGRRPTDIFALKTVQTLPDKLGILMSPVAALNTSASTIHHDPAANPPSETVLNHLIAAAQKKTSTASTKLYQATDVIGLVGSLYSSFATDSKAEQKTADLITGAVQDVPKDAARVLDNKLSVLERGWAGFMTILNLEDIISVPGKKVVIKEVAEETLEYAGKQIVKHEAGEKLLSLLKTRIATLISGSPREQLWRMMEEVDGVLRPRVDDVELQRRFINELYKPSAGIGYGSTADIIRHYKELGIHDPSDHITKATTRIVGLKNWLIKFPEATDRDKKIINLIIQDLEDALNFKP